MNNQLEQEIAEARQLLLNKANASEDPKQILKAPELKALYERLRIIDPVDRPAFGKALNELRAELQAIAEEKQGQQSQLPPIDVTAPFAPGARPELNTAEFGSIHPINQEIAFICSIFRSMGFSVLESREIDDDMHMFTSLNFPEDHPARDDFDTFMTLDKDGNGKPYVAPAHTSTMQQRALIKYKDQLEQGQPIAVVIPGRVFRNEDVDARHEHTFYQFEGVFVSKNVTIGNLTATLTKFLESYFKTDIKFKTQPFYFPFTEPSFEYALSCPFCKQAGCGVCSYSGWIELLGTGMVHPEVLKMAGIDPLIYQGFAWGCGVDRLVMLKYGVEDIRLLHSGRLEFLRQFKGAI